MRKKKEAKVVLAAPDGTRAEFGVPHAERLLDMGPALNGGWRLPDDSGYAYDEENGLRPLARPKAPTAEEE